jgi:hypothetical protein
VSFATAAAHNPPKPGEPRKKAVNYLDAASIIARIDPVKYGVLESFGTERDISMPPAPDHFIVHLSDSDYHHTEQAASAVIDKIRSLVVSALGWKLEETHGARFNWLRNELLSKHTEMGLYQLVIENSQHKLIKLIQDTLKRSGRSTCYIPIPASELPRRQHPPEIRRVLQLFL